MASSGIALSLLVAVLGTDAALDRLHPAFSGVELVGLDPRFVGLEAWR